MQESAPARFARLIRSCIALLLGLAVVLLVLLTYRWPLFWDAQVFHYGNFLIAHGFVPYRDILDMNMPGAYLFDGWATKLFGGGDLGWRLFDLALLGALSVAMVVIARPYDWLAGWFASVIWALIHTAEGTPNLGQRDEIIAVMLMIACAFLFEARRRRLAWLTFFFGLSFGLACSIKPTYLPLGAGVFALAVWDCKRNGERIAAFSIGSLTGLAVAAAIVARFLWQPGAAAALVTTTRKLTPFYAGMERVNYHLLLRFSLPIAVWVLLPLALTIWLARRLRSTWEQVALLFSASVGAFSYFLQGKAYPYQRYTFTAFLMLWISMQLFSSVQRNDRLRTIGVVGIGAGLLVFVPFYLRNVQQTPVYTDYTRHLETDLHKLGAERLQRRVQCLDLVDGCYTALYHLGIVQSTGVMGDLILFAPRPSPVVSSYRDQFWNQVEKNPPAVFVLSNENFNQAPTFAKLDAWPEFARYLQEHYRVVASREFPNEKDHGYRIYVREGTSLPQL